MDIDIKLVSVEEYKKFTETNYLDFNFRCDDRQIAYALVNAQNYVESIITPARFNYMCCEPISATTESITDVKRAICIYAYDYIEMYFSNIDTDSPIASVENNTFLFLKNNRLIHA